MALRFKTKQRAYVGLFALAIVKNGEWRNLLHGGGVIAPRPRLYETEAAATEAARAQASQGSLALIVVELV